MVEVLKNVEISTKNQSKNLTENGSDKLCKKGSKHLPKMSQKVTNKWVRNRSGTNVEKMIFRAYPDLLKNFPGSPEPYNIKRRKTSSWRKSKQKRCSARLGAVQVRRNPSQGQRASGASRPGADLSCLRQHSRSGPRKSKCARDGYLSVAVLALFRQGSRGVSA